MLAFGEEGYLVAAKAILEAAAVIRRGIEAIPELFVLGDPLWVIAFASDELDVYAVMDQMSQRGWSLNGLQQPPAAHICVTLRHAQPGIADRFVTDLESSVETVRGATRCRRGHGPHLRHDRGGEDPGHGRGAAGPLRRSPIQGLIGVRRWPPDVRCARSCGPAPSR